MPDDLLLSFRDRLHRGPDPALLADLEHAVLARRDDRSGHTDWGLLCEDAGLLPLAFREFQLALRDDPNDAVAAFRLAHHYRERGDTRRAADLLERLLQTSPAREDWLPSMSTSSRDDGAPPRIAPPSTAPSSAGLAPERRRRPRPGRGRRRRGRAADERRRSPPATPTASASRACSPAAKTSTPASGPAPAAKAATAPSRSPSPPPSSATTSSAPTPSASTPSASTAPAPSSPLDLDIDKAALEQARTPARPRPASCATPSASEARRLLDVLRGLGFAPLFEDSGYKGRHFWVFLEQPEPAEVLHQFGRLLLAWQTAAVAARPAPGVLPQAGRTARARAWAT